MPANKITFLCQSTIIFTVGIKYSLRDLLFYLNNYALYAQNSD